MNINELYQFVVHSDGSNRLQRMQAALEPSFAQIDDRSLRDMLAQVYQLAKTVRFFDTNGQPQGDWTPFWGELLQDALSGQMLPEETIETALQYQTKFTPQFALLLVFLKIREYLKADLNAFTGKHLDFYYRDLLKQGAREAIPDTVHLVFELAKSATEYRLPAGTPLGAGKDASGNQLFYKTNREIVLNTAKVSAIKSLFVESVLGLGSKVWVADMTDLEQRQKTPPTDSAGAWSLLGSPQHSKLAQDRTMTLGRVGFAIGSFLFLLQEGVRTVTLTLTSANTTPGAFTSRDMKNDLAVRFSGATEWVAAQVQFADLVAFDGINPVSLLSGHYATLAIKIILSPDQPPIVGYQDSALQNGYQSTQPLMEITLQPDSWQYPTLRDFQIARVVANTDVLGVKTFGVRNDDAQVDPKKPFQLFGSQPFKGTQSYIQSREMFYKRLTKLTLRLVWQNPPVNFTEYYKGWSDSAIGPSNFQSSMELLVNNSPFELTGGFFSLFSTELNGDTSTEKSFSLSGAPLDQAYPNGVLPNRSKIPATDSEITGTSGGAIRFVLLQAQNMPFEAFGHRDFPLVLARQAAKLIADPGNPDITLPQPPYTPVVRSLEFDYTAEEEILNPLAGADDFIQINPFGSRVLKSSEAALAPVLPSSGHVYLGISNFTLPGLLHVFFALQKGEAVLPDFISTPGAASGIAWSYLHNEIWKPFSTELLTDNTQQLQKLGLIAFSVPDSPGAAISSMPPGYFWIRGIADKDFGKTARAAAVFGQAVDATLEPDAAGSYAVFDQHLATGLPPNTITKLVKPVPAVKTVQQPIASTGGRASENPNLYYARISERLRHKNRAVGAWDFERLILEQFPDIFKSKVLPAGTFADWQPGQVDIIVIPAHGNGNLEPKAGGFQLDEVSTFLAAHSSAFARIKVQNPVYERIFLDFKVQFNQGLDPGYYAKVLNEDLLRYLTPWAYSADADVRFGASVRRSELMFFVETRSYVKVLTDFRMYHLHDTRLKFLDSIGKMIVGESFVVRRPRKPTIGGMTIGENFIVGEDVEIAVATGPASILVSFPQHRIQILREEEVCVGIADFGIGSMTIAVDFTVSASF